MGTGSEEAILIGSRDAIGSGGGVYSKAVCGIHRALSIWQKNSSE